MRHYLGRDRDAGCDYLCHVADALEILRSGHDEHRTLSEWDACGRDVSFRSETHLDGTVDRRHVRRIAEISVPEGQSVEETVPDLRIRILGTVAVETLGSEEQDLVLLHLVEGLPVRVESAGLGGRPIDGSPGPCPLQEEAVRCAVVHLGGKRIRRYDEPHPGRII